jgi:hypothetical protein
MKTATVFILGSLILTVPAWAGEAEKGARRSAPEATDPSAPATPGVVSGEDDANRAPAPKKDRVRFTYPSSATKRM